MPRVNTPSGTKKFPYSPAGKAAAKREAKKPMPAPMKGGLKRKMPRI